MLPRNQPLYAAFSEKRILVVGSAPHANFCSEAVYDLVILVNGAASRSMPENLYGPERMLFLDSSLMWNSEPHVIETLKLILENSRESLPIIVSASNPVYFTTDKLPSLPIVISFSESMRILRKTISSKPVPKFPNGMPSTGVRAAVTAFYFGARSVDLAGFSFGLGGKYREQYFYKSPANENRSVSRNHSCADAFTLSSLSLLGHEISTSEPDLEPLFTQWNNEDSWAKVGRVREFFLTLAFRGHLGILPVLIQRLKKRLWRF